MLGFFTACLVVVVVAAIELGVWAVWCRIHDYDKERKC